MEADKRLDPSVIHRLRQDIQENEGREVLWVGRVNAQKRVVEITTAARGDEDSVNALFPLMERGDVVIHNHPSGRLVPSGPDMAIAGRLGDQGIGFFIVNNAVTKLTAVTEPLVLEELKPLSVGDLASHLEEGGSLSRRIPGYECRPSQVELLKLIAKGFNEDALVCAEAGTGVGKSFAYLLPTLDWARRNKERVVVSTATINLQQQLLEKDIPVVQELLGTQLKVVLVKGRGNYLCPSRLEEELREGPSDGPDRRDLEALKEWSETTKTGSRSDLALNLSDGLWSRVCSEAEVCRGLRCGFREECFVVKSRKEAAAAQVLVANHHLVFADLSLRLQGFGFEATAVLPPFQRLVFDEAHSLEKSATSYFSQSYSRPSLMKTLHRLYRRRKAQVQGLAKALQGLATGDVDFEAFPRLVDHIGKQAEIFDTLAVNYLGSEPALRLLGEPTGPLEDQVLGPLEELRRSLSELSGVTKKLTDCFEDTEEDLPPEVFELRSVASRIEGFLKFFSGVRNYNQDPASVTWLEKNRDGRGGFYVQVHISPLDVSPFLREAVYEPYPTVVFTSATLTIKDRFTFWARRIGLGLVDKDRILSGIFPSPFDYKNRVLLGSPTDFPLPEDPAFQPQLAQYLSQLLLAAGGSALVLFTSFEVLRYCHDLVKPSLDRAGINLFRQGDLDRSRLLDQFKQDITSVLFATDSFWEGVDSPGDTLRLVVICRLPFRVPSDPVTAARMEDLTKRGLDSFQHYSLPDAVTRFKQGFGRLMRRQDDSGAVVVLDSRILRKPYGRVFIEALPPTRTAFEDRKTLLDTLSSFLKATQK